MNISSATWAGGIATFNTSAAHTLAVGDKTVTAGVTPSGYNIPAGAIVLSVPTTTQFTVAHGRRSWRVHQWWHVEPDQQHDFAVLCA